LRLRLGVHVSIEGGIDQAVDRAKQLACTTFQIFTRNPRGWRFKPLADDEVHAFVRKSQAAGFDAIIAHMPYLANLASPVEALYKQSVETLVAEVGRCGQLGIRYLVTHLGSHLGSGKAFGARRIIGACQRALRQQPNNVTILLENTAGQKNSNGSSVDDLRFLLDGIEPQERVGVCFDTCHAFAAGYDLRTEGAVHRTLELFEEAVGFRNVHVIHLNDSKGELNCGADRHEHIGRGYIGERGFRAFLRQDRIRPLPLILETPIDAQRDHAGNLKKVRQLAE
jgi:deoxyribonuclease-4